MKALLALSGVALLAAASGCASSRPCYAKSRTNEVRHVPAYYAQDAHQHDSSYQYRGVGDDTRYYTDNSLVGPRGPDGPAGPIGERGEIGQTGVPGYAMVGPRGDRGAIGYAGDQGPMGPTGPSGALVRGRTGVQGAPGQMGAQGASGQIGIRGASAPGYAGPTGPQGPSGYGGEMGMAGVRGRALEGPTGPAGFAGRSGAQGPTGYIGAQGITTPGLAGPTGPAGPQGPRGGIGETGAQGRVGVVGNWTSFREFWFDQGSDDLSSFNQNLVREIATYINQNPSLTIGIDGSLDQRGTSARDQDLNNRRVSAIRSALVNAGVPSHKIKTGAFGDFNLRQERRVEVLFATAN